MQSSGRPLSLFLNGDMNAEQKLEWMRLDKDAHFIEHVRRVGEGNIFCRACDRSFAVVVENYEKWVTHKATCMRLQYVVRCAATEQDTDMTIPLEISSGASTRGGLISGGGGSGGGGRST